MHCLSLEFMREPSCAADVFAEVLAASTMTKRDCLETEIRACVDSRTNPGQTTVVVRCRTRLAAIALVRTWWPGCSDAWVHDVLRRTEMATAESLAAPR